MTTGIFSKKCADPSKSGSFIDYVVQKRFHTMLDG